MAQKFKVGDRVRIISGGAGRVPVGAEGVIAGAGNCIDWEVRYEPNLNRNNKYAPHEGWGFWSYELAPLTDPKAEQFIERIKNLKPLEEKPQNLNADELHTVRGGVA